MTTEKHAVHGCERTEFDRPPRELIERLARHETAKVADSMGGYGVMHHEIKPLTPEMKIAGPAFTVLTKPGDALYVQRAIDFVQPGDVVVIDAAGFKDVCVIGERLAYFFQRRGVAGIVVDGAVRDSQGIVDLGLPVFSRSVCIKIFGSTGPGAINVPIQSGGVPISPGDIILGDRDGVIAVPKDDARRVLDLADEHLHGELDRVKEVESGKNVSEVFGLDEKIARWTK
ncbi:MAG: hypothetical protein WD314_02245 [Trueperaceae bacterium]